MEIIKDDILLGDIEPRLSTRSLNALKLKGIDSINGLLNLDELELIHTRNLGEISVDEIIRYKDFIRCKILEDNKILVLKQEDAEQFFRNNLEERSKEVKELFRTIMVGHSFTTMDGKYIIRLLDPDECFNLISRISNELISDDSYNDGASFIENGYRCKQFSRRVLSNISEYSPLIFISISYPRDTMDEIVIEAEMKLYVKNSDGLVCSYEKPIEIY